MHKDPNHPELARESQDVESPPQRSEDSVHFTGRGGVANAYIPTITTGHGAGEQQRQRGSLVGGMLDAQPLSDQGSSKDRTREAIATTAVAVAVAVAARSYTSSDQKEAADLRP